MPAQITLDELPELRGELSSAGPGLAGMRAGDGGYRHTARRRRSDVHRIVASILAVLALVGCVTAVLLLAIAPTASRMQNDITSLTGRLNSAESQLAALQTAAVHTARQGSRLTKRIRLLDRHMTGLGRTIHGLQGSSGATREETDALRACFAALQAQLGGLELRTRFVHGRMTTVGLTETASAPASCGAALSSS